MEDDPNLQTGRPFSVADPAGGSSSARAIGETVAEYKKRLKGHRQKRPLTVALIGTAEQIKEAFPEINSVTAHEIILAGSVFIVRNLNRDRVKRTDPWRWIVTLEKKEIPRG